MKLTSDVLHRDLELLPVPDMLVPRHLLHDPPKLVQPLAGLRAEIVSPNAIPVILGYFARLTAIFDGL